MKTKAKRHDVAVSGFEGFSFTAEMNAEMFDLLINKMYSNKIQAVVRELGANAVDSHIAAGHKKNFHIQVPDTKNMEFVIRDYGVGLTSDEVKTLYTCLGRSSKRETNDQIGCIGIGSKAPFAYTKKFYIISYKDGLKHTYCAYIDNDNLPKIAIMEEDAKTNEPNGLEVKVPINNTDSYQASLDCQQFQKEIRSVYEFFTIKPDCKINKLDYDLDFGDIKYSSEGKSYSSYTNYSYRYSYNYEPNIRIVMGGIKYGFNKSYFKTKIKNSNLDLIFDIGELDVAGNREELSYNDTTIKAIQKKIDKAEDLIAQEVSKKITNAKCEYEAYIEAKKHSSCGLTLYYNNKQIRSDFKCQTDVRVIQFNNGTRDEYEMGGFYSINLNIGYSNNTKPTIVVNDLKRGGISRTKEYSKQNNGYYYLFFSEDKKDLDAVLSALGINSDYVKKASELPAPPRQKRTSQNKVYKYISKPNVYRGYGKSEFDDPMYNYWSETDDDLDDVYYVYYDRGRFYNEKEKYHPAYLGYFMELMDIKTVYGIPKSKKDEIEFDGKELIKEFKSNYKVKQAYSNPVHSYDLKRYKQLSCLNGFCKDIDAFTKKVNSFKLLPESKRTALKKVDNIVSLKEPKQENFKEEYNKILAKYPLLEFVESNLSNKKVQTELTHYFKGLNK